LFPFSGNTPIDRIQNRLLNLAALFLLVYSITFTLSPAAVAQSWQVDFRWEHWIGLCVWLIGFNAVNLFIKRWMPNRNPYLLPIAALLSGWGLLTIWRLYPEYGWRQSAWLLLSSAVLVVGARLPTNLVFLRRYKYLWLTGSLTLTALTLFLGTNPLGYGPRMWLGCCGIYLQPSEPLKFMLIAYLAAYLADHQPFLLLSTTQPSPSRDNSDPSSQLKFSILRTGLISLLAPTFIMTGMTLILLIVQRDLGTATIFMILYSVIIYVATGRKKVIWIAGLVLAISGVAGYWFFDVVRIRVDAWLNPFLDPTGGSYQIVQSLIAIANGEVFGRGPGLGYPNLIPLAHSDLIFSAIVEEHGLIGALGLIMCLLLFLYHGFSTAMHASDIYRRYLASGLTAYLVGQSILIICGNLRLLPLTGVTLPFVSYGGSSLMTATFALLFLLHISNHGEGMPAPFRTSGAYRHLNFFFFASLSVIAFSVGWWSIYRASDLISRTDNPRRAIADLYVQRGAIVDQRNRPINESVGISGQFVRKVNYPDLSNVTGYIDPIYGQSGLEASLDGYLRGNEGNPVLTIWWDRLVYGLPPSGRTLRTSLDLDMQTIADQRLAGFKGAIILINAQTGEILIMASHPVFDANHLSEEWDSLVKDPDSPLLNRAIFGLYPIGELGDTIFQELLQKGGNDTDPQLRLPSLLQPTTQGNSLQLSPLQVALLSATISGKGIRPAPLFVTAVNTSDSQWEILPPVEKPVQVIESELAALIVNPYRVPGLDIWETEGVVTGDTNNIVTWYIGGTSVDWDSTPYAITVLLEGDLLRTAKEMGQELLLNAILPVPK
jgi:cell division protein FtsW (lipid II flippase)